ncbi:hypothetical protein PoB_004965500 [Plakobranchus ocellatus]|uniref:Secreted protein n=1 Tax=Plakobranchus ocellatus TaxID=259542 RepID=A0AAV4BV10_9GAST|nr:hypothetical protein PoB_004965500 [Plakobranchus ocellatus]
MISCITILIVVGVGRQAQTRCRKVFLVKDRVFSHRATSALIIIVSLAGVGGRLKFAAERSYRSKIDFSSPRVTSSPWLWHALVEDSNPLQKSPTG